MINIVYNCDCMEFMKDKTDNYYNLAIVDPPYGIGGDKNKTITGKGGKAKTFKETIYHEPKSWDNSIPDKKYFIELNRISKNQIIWGGNYFTKYLHPVKAWIFWYKKLTNPNNHTHSDGELAWTSFKAITRMISIDWIGFGYINSGEKKIHTSQKPVALYKWLLQNYAKPGQKIFDSHVGSGSIRIACHDMGFDFEGCEIDKDYYDAQEKRFQAHIQQNELFKKTEYQEIIYKDGDLSES
jgi:site-specific DNA-methyltransferase (adenine-specific)